MTSTDLDKYDIIFFDLDNTLLDFTRSEKTSFIKTMEYLGIETDLEILHQNYSKINLELWKLFEKGEVSKDQIRYERFERLNKKFNLEIDHNRASSFYMEQLKVNVFFCDYAKEVCEKLAKSHTLGMITNGVAEVQYKRLEKTNLTPFFKSIIVSEEAGVPKPHRKIFKYALDKMQANGLEKILMVGDRLESDIRGANEMNWDTCYIRGHEKIETSITATFVVDSLESFL